MAGWRDEVVLAVQAAAPRQTAGSSRPKWKPYGPASEDGARRPGWFAVDVRGVQVRVDAVDAMRLAPRDSPDPNDGYRVMEAVHDGEVLYVRVGSHVHAPGLSLYARQQSQAFLWEKLREGLEVMSSAGLPDALARGRLAPIIEVAPSDAEDWNSGQRRAYGACRSPGLHVVWGPPGTGKTRVLARAIADLVADGKRVLLVSNANVAVDNALQGVLKLTVPEPGRFVRVGPPQIPDIADDERVALPRLVASRCREVERRRADVETKLLDLRERQVEVERINARLDGYDPAAHERARAALAAETRISELAQRLHQCEAERTAREVVLARAQGDAQAARREDDALSPAREALAEATRLQDELETLEIGIGSAQAEVLRAQSRLREAEDALEQRRGDGLLARVLERGQRARLAAQRDAVEAELASIEEHAQEARRLHERQRQLLEPRIAAAIRRANGVTEHDLRRSADRARAARAAADRATVAAQETTEARDEAAQALLSAEAGPRATGADRQLVEEAERQGWPRLHVERARLVAELGAVGNHEALEREHERLLDQLDDLRRDAEGAIIRGARLVAMTLSRFRIHPATMSTPRLGTAQAERFDVVLVDEVSAASVPEVLLALGAARDTAVLFGDFLQLGAILPGDASKLDESIRRWWTEDCFARVGIRTPKDATDQPACVVLAEQYRFGPTITCLANRILYGDVLRDGRELPPSEGELVLLDTDGLGHLGRIRRSGKIKGWWPAGALLARALAQHHRERDQRVGVVAPYRDQVHATTQALRDVEPLGGRLPSEVGTVHAFQGREFDVMILDLVEDGSGAMMTARANGTRWDRDYARLFGVGLTRGRQRTYLVASGSAVRRAHGDTVLAAVARMIEQGRIAQVPATHYLAPSPSQLPAIEGPVDAEIAEAFRRHVRVRDIHDEHSFYDTLVELIPRARRSIWMWAPWTATRTDSLLSLLAGAISRGVRITLFTRDGRDNLQGKEPFQRRLRALRHAGVHVIHYRDVHQKIVVLDGEISFVGSLNALSHRNTREIMLEHEGSLFAGWLLEDQQAEVFARVPRCERCGGDEVELARSGSERNGYRWYWRCPASGCGWRTDVAGAGASARSYKGANQRSAQ